MADDIEELENRTHTAQSIQRTGIPTITFGISPSRVTTYPTDPTFQNEGQPADAKACGDRFDTDESLITELGADLADLSTSVGTISTMLDALYPVGSVYVTTGSVTPPSAFGTWAEIKVPMKWGEANSGNWNYTTGTGTGNIHFWRRTA